MEKIVRVVAKPFSSFAREEYEFCVDEDGTVHVWDSIAGHYTLCHSLSQREQQRIRETAESER